MDSELTYLYRRIMYSYWAILKGVQKEEALRINEITEAQFNANFETAKSDFYTNNWFYKDNDEDIVHWVMNNESIGEHLFTFDKEKIYNIFADYPHNLTAEEIAIFNKENSYWQEFFKDRLK